MQNGGERLAELNRCYSKRKLERLVILMYRIGVISDTHGLLREEVVQELKRCDVILHGGDINKQEVLEKLKEIAPVHAVRGNADKEWAEYLPETLAITLAGLHIFMIHNKKMIKEDVNDKDIVIYGHSHKYDEKMIKTENAGQNAKDQLWLNPGSCGTRRFSLPVTMAVIEVDTDRTYQVRKIEFDNNDTKKQKTLETACAGDRKKLIQSIMKDTDRGIPFQKMAEKYGIPTSLAEQICRLYLTHQGIDADGILGKMG